MGVDPHTHNGIVFLGYPKYLVNIFITSVSILLRYFNRNTPQNVIIGVGVDKYCGVCILLLDLVARTAPFGRYHTATAPSPRWHTPVIDAAIASTTPPSRRNPMKTATMNKGAPSATATATSLRTTTSQAIGAPATDIINRNYAQSS